MSKVLRFVVSIVSAVMIVLGADVAFGQAYPNKPVRIVTNEPGGGPNFVARLIAEGISGPLGQPVIVENHPGSIMNEIVAHASPDGYTLLLDGTSFYTASLLQKMPYDPVKDFLPITLVGSSPGILVVHPTVPAKSVKELIDLAKAKPGELNYASGGAGSPNHLSAELFKAMAGVNIVRIAYKGGGPALNALIGGEVQMMFVAGGTAAPYLKSGRFRALAVTSAEPSALFPNMPTVTASGLPGFEMVQMLGIFAPAKTPETVINRLNQEIARFLNATGPKEKLLSAGIEAASSSPQQFAAMIKSEMVKVDKVIKTAGIRLD